MSRSKLLIPSEPLQVIPELAVLIGLNEAIVLQQLHYWVGKYQRDIPKREYIYNTLEQWHIQFPFWSTRTIRRTLKSLVNQDLVRITKGNKRFCDHTNWYTINYEAIDNLEQKSKHLSEQLNKMNAEIGFKRRLRYGHSVPTVETK